MPDNEDLAMKIAAALGDHKAQDVVVMDLRGLAGWTDYFVIGTCSSSVHMRGLAKAVEEAAHAAEIPALNTPSFTEDQNWLLYDLGDIVVHLMTKEAREFYELEKLWHKAPTLRLPDR